MAQEKQGQDKHWMKDAFKPATKGALHEQLGVDPAKKIPAKKMTSALKGRFGTLAKQRAQAAHNANK